jgi:hypothetical protein
VSFHPTTTLYDWLSQTRLLMATLLDAAGGCKEGVGEGAVVGVGGAAMIGSEAVGPLSSSTDPEAKQ